VNFNRYINRLRIEQAKRQLAENQTLSILRIAYECGFATKSAFNAAFKLETGQTPTQFAKTAEASGKRKKMRTES
jgi:AraC-like DNA-binding protein